MNRRDVQRVDKLLRIVLLSYVAFVLIRALGRLT